MGTPDEEAIPIENWFGVGLKLSIKFIMEKILRRG